MKKNTKHMALSVILAVLGSLSALAMLPETPEAAVEKTVGSTSAAFREDEVLITCFGDNDEVLPCVLTSYTVSPGDTIALPRYVELLSYAPSGMIPKAVRLEDTEYPLGSLFTIPAEGGSDLYEFFPVFEASDEEVVFFEDMESYAIDTQLVAGGAAPQYTALKINGVSSAWTDFENCFYLRAIDSYPAMRVTKDRSGSGNRAIMIDWWGTSNANIGIATQKTPSGAMGFAEPGTYRASVDVYVPSVFGNSWYTASGTSNTTYLVNADGTAKTSVRLRAEVGDDMTMASQGITAGALDKWFTLTCEFTLEEGQSLKYLRTLLPGTLFQFYVDNYKLVRVMRREAYIDYDLDGTPDKTVEFDVGSTVTLPRYADCVAYAPVGMMPAGVKVGDKEYALGASYTFTAEDGIHPIITPVYALSDEDVIFYENMEGYTVGTPVVSGGAAPKYTPLKINGVTSRWTSWEDSFYFRNIDSYADMCIANAPGGSNKAFRIDWWGGSNAFAGMSPMKTGASMGFNVPGKYRVSVDMYVPSVISGSTYLPNGSSNTASLVNADGTAKQSMQLRAETADGVIKSTSVGVTSATLDTWNTLSFDFTLAEGETLYYLRAMLPGTGHQFYIDNFRFAKLLSTATIYLDTAKSVPTSAGTFTFAAGDAVTLPSYADVLPYAPSGTVPLGYEIGGVLYGFGETYTFRGSDESNMEIVPSFGIPETPVLGAKIFFEDFEGFDATTNIAAGGAGGVTHTEISLADGVSEAFSDYAGSFTVRGVDTLSTIKIMTDFSKSNKALHFEGWCPGVQSAVRLSASSGASMGIDEPGTYTYKLDYYIPSNYKQPEYNGGANTLATVGKSLRIWFEVSDGANTKQVPAELVFDGSEFDAWNTLEATVALKSGETITRLLVFTKPSASDTAGEFYIDNIALYYNANTVSYQTSEGDELYTAFVREGDVITLPGKDEIGFEPLFTYDGKEYYAGETIMTAFDDSDLVITVSALPSPKLIEAASIRLDAPLGLRFAAFVSEEKRAEVDEYGFIITTEELLDGADAKTLTFDGTVRYVSGAAYEKATGVDKVYSTDGSEFGGKAVGDGYYYTGVLINIPKTSYDAVFVARPYLRIGDKVFYGMTIERSVNEVAEASGITLE